MYRAIPILAWVFAPVLASASIPPEAPRALQAQEKDAGLVQENGAARWSTTVSSNLSDVCRLTGLDRKIELGEAAKRSPRGDAHDCVASSAWVHNLSPQPIYCRVSLKLRKPDDSGRTEISGQDLVLPGARRNLATAYGEEKRAPSKAVTKCDVNADTYLPPAPSCELKIISVPDPNLFYPEESRRRAEQGDVTLDFRVDMSARKPRDLRVSEGSGYRSLDLAALRVGRKMVTTATCPGLRGTIRMNFRLTAGETPSLRESPPAN